MLRKCGVGEVVPVQVINRLGTVRTINVLRVQRQNHIGIQPHKPVKRVTKLTMQNRSGTHQQVLVKPVRQPILIGMERNV